MKSRPAGCIGLPHASCVVNVCLLVLPRLTPGYCKFRSVISVRARQPRGRRPGIPSRRFGWSVNQRHVSSNLLRSPVDSYFTVRLRASIEAPITLVFRGLHIPMNMNGTARRPETIRQVLSFLCKFRRYADPMQTDFLVTFCHFRISSEEGDRLSQLNEIVQPNFMQMIQISWHFWFIDFLDSSHVKI